MKENRISPTEAHRRLQSGECVLLDVRSLEEHSLCRADGAQCLPLDTLARRAAELPKDRPILVICQSGNRSKAAVETLRGLGFTDICDVEGGTSAWRAAGLPTTVVRDVWPLERQVRFVAGLLVTLFGLLGFLVHPGFFAGAVTVGGALTLTAALGICPMMAALRLLPWNRA
jgi:rhodanese-related sulfurtransferase